MEAVKPVACTRCGGCGQLADAVIARLNPRDGDEAEVSLCIQAIGIIADFVESLPCDCMPDIYDRPPCDRCRALGQRNGEPVER